MTDETNPEAPAADAAPQADPEATQPPVPPEGDAAPAADAAPAVPPAQAGDPEPELAKPVAQPVFQSLEEGKAELEANPARTSVLTDAGVLVRE